MEFDKAKVYTALNADESLIGAKGYFADDIETLKYKVGNTGTIQHYKETFCERLVSDIDDSYKFFYLVEPAPEKWYVYKIIGSDGYTNPINYPISVHQLAFEGTKKECEQWIAEHSKPKYRPFKDCDELIKTYKEKLLGGVSKSDTAKLYMPTIWVKLKDKNRQVQILGFENDNEVLFTNGRWNVCDLLRLCTFLDGSVCGVEDDK